MKKTLTLLLTLGLLFILSSPVFASSDVKINANGNILKDAQAVIQNGSTLLPVRSVSNAFGCEVNWDGDTKTVSVNKGDTQITIVIGQKELTVNDTKQTISAPAQIINGRTYVPLRALGEALNCEIQWVNDTRTVEITPNDPAEYKAWYEVDENGNLYIKTNISSRKWNGYSMISILNHNNDSSWNEYFGQGMVQCIAEGFYSHRDIGTIINSNELYIFKGIHKEIRDNAKKMDADDIISSLSNHLVYKVTLDNTIYVKDSGKTLTIDSIILTDNNQKAIYSISTADSLSDSGEYYLHYELTSASRENYDKSLSKKDNLLTCNIASGYFPIHEKTGQFHISHCIYSMDTSGNITLSKTSSNKIDSNTLL